MIIKGTSRSRSAQLAAHLLRTDQNEQIRLHECQGTVAQSVEGALAEMETLGAGVRGRKPLYHASISPQPGQRMTAAQWERAIHILESKLGFQGQPRLVLFHIKGGREHAHVVWCRVDLRQGRMIPDSWNYARHEEASREMEQAFGHERIAGAHMRIEGEPRPRRGASEYELRQAERSGLDRVTISRELTQLWHGSADAKSFQRAIEAAGYQLVRGDRRSFVVLDRAGEAHSLSRRLEGVSASAMRTKLTDIDLARLPAVAEGRQKIKHRVQAASWSGAGPAAMVTTFSLPMGRASRPIRLSVRNSSAHLAERATILAVFAGKIADACATAAPDEIAARLARLRDEEAASVDALDHRVQAERASSRLHIQRVGFRAASVQVTWRRVRRPSHTPTWKRPHQKA